jgi:hypothetical protein
VTGWRVIEHLNITHSRSGYDKKWHTSKEMVRSVRKGNGSLR